MRVLRADIAGSQFKLYETCLLDLILLIFYSVGTHPCVPPFFGKEAAFGAFCFHPRTTKPFLTLTAKITTAADDSLE